MDALPRRLTGSLPGRPLFPPSPPGPPLPHAPTPTLLKPPPPEPAAAEVPPYPAWNPVQYASTAPSTRLLSHRRRRRKKYRHSPSLLPHPPSLHSLLSLLSSQFHCLPWNPLPNNRLRPASRTSSGLPACWHPVPRFGYCSASGASCCFGSNCALRLSDSLNTTLSTTDRRLRVWAHFSPTSPPVKPPPRPCILPAFAPASRRPPGILPPRHRRNVHTFGLRALGRPRPFSVSILLPSAAATPSCDRPGPSAAAAAAVVVVEITTTAVAATVHRPSAKIARIAAKLDSQETPPPLQYSTSPSERDRPSPVESGTPLSTPKTHVHLAFPRKPERERERDLYFCWHRRGSPDPDRSSNLFLDSAILDSDLADESFPLFEPPATSSTAARMAEGSAPIDIALPRQNSTSPRQASNRTSALQVGGKDGAPTAPMNIGKGREMGVSGLTPHSGAVPIGGSRAQPRRESMAGSMMNGMSWGGVSMNSWVRDDIMMQGTSPFASEWKSPSYHSSSYLPKLEANFMKDFTCCGLVLPSLHDLLQHYEEAHAQQIAPAGGVKAFPPNFANPTSSNKADGSAQQGKQQRLPVTNDSVRTPQSNRNVKETTPKPQAPAAQDMEALDDMEMDDIDNAGDGFSTNPAGYTISQTDDFPNASFGGPNPAVTPLDLAGIQVTSARSSAFQGIRQSQPTTPLGSGRQFQHNPTVSSVNTPTINANPQSRLFQTTPDTSVPGTPAELDPEFLGDLSNMSMDNPSFMTNQPQDFQNFGFNGGNELGELCIDDPAKRLFRPTGPSSQAAVHARLGNAQYGPDSEVARNIRDRQIKAGLADTVTGIPQGEEPKPFRCPVIGCEKAYKNQNGLKYHKSHGHNNQQLHENADGTFSIVDPSTNSIYPGTMGMEKEKPYKCDVCGKRYKNLNGLKYHKTHSPPCNPDLKINAGVPINANAANANVASAGLNDGA